MFTPVGAIRALSVLGGLGVALGIGGCAAKVTRQDFNAEVAKLREEVRQETASCPAGSIRRISWWTITPAGSMPWIRSSKPSGANTT
jgi:hypothetical protein